MIAICYHLTDVDGRCARSISLHRQSDDWGSPSSWKPYDRKRVRLLAWPVQEGLTSKFHAALVTACHGLVSNRKDLESSLEAAFTSYAKKADEDQPGGGSPRGPSLPARLACRVR
jgi:hypothetical protein